ncbi:hypothetical protein A2Z67_04840 [Candidatus Woesebacteria bacterium RBG_13_36_22]|uniref:Uncharacterized protein n=1 Tax=Candidatus Woesebacteria bacterium RBG_13_36_22 TaxID=1802478 RepID=A0A1F7X2M7_9BACT|nr:MAG: hypothetical protein A2Z67_04840 [Candidatus Woesebacteria bacterium RBG_13_36_22]
MRVKTSTCEKMRRWSLILTVATFVFFWFSTYPGAKSGLRMRDLSEGGTALWIFLILGAIIILLQLIPALIMFFSLVGTGTTSAYKTKETREPAQEMVAQESNIVLGDQAGRDLEKA